MARWYLATPATSALVERVFSIRSNVVIKGRNRLDPETVKQIVLLKSWKIKELKELEANFQASAAVEEYGEE
jgi:hypothetical protein